LLSPPFLLLVDPCGEVEIVKTEEVIKTQRFVTNQRIEVWLGQQDLRNFYFHLLRIAAVF